MAASFRAARRGAARLAFFPASELIESRKITPR